MTDAGAARLRFAVLVVCTYPLVHLLGGFADLASRLAISEGSAPRVHYARYWSIGILISLLVVYTPRRLCRPDVPAWAKLILIAVVAWAGIVTALAEPAEVSAYGLRRLVDLLVVAGLAMAVAGILCDRPDLSARTPWLLVAAGLASAVPVAATDAMVGLANYTPHTLLPGVSTLREWGQLLTGATLAAAGLTLSLDRRSERLTAAFALAFLWALLLWSGSRGGSLSVLTALLVSAFVLPGLGRRWAFVLAALVAGALMSLWPAAPLPAYDVLGQLTSDAPPEPGGVSSHRAEIWAQTLSQIAAKPLVGHGYLQGWTVIDWPTQPLTHVHNLPLELALGLGLPAAVAAGILLGSAMLWSLRLARCDPQCVPAFLTLLGLGGMSLVSGPYLHFEGLVPATLMAAVLMARDALLPEQPRTAKACPERYGSGRMPKINGNEIRPGNVLEHNDGLWVAAKVSHVKPGKGGAFAQVEMKNLRNGSKLNERFRAADKVERVRLEQKDQQFLYENDGMLVFMDTETYDQIELPADILGDRRPFLQDGMTVTIEYYESEALSATLPQKVTCTIVETEPAVKGQTAANSFKPAVLDNGVRVMVPPFVGQDEQIVVNTETMEYAERA